MQKLLTVKQLSNLLSVNPASVYKMVKRNEIPYIRAGKKCYRFDPEEIQRWKEQRTMGPQLP